jgi:hypothetical protein
LACSQLIFPVGFVVSQIFNPHKDSWIASAIEKIPDARNETELLVESRNSVSMAF